MLEYDPAVLAELTVQLRRTLGDPEAKVTISRQEAIGRWLVAIEWERRGARKMFGLFSHVGEPADEAMFRLYGACTDPSYKPFN